MAALVWLLAHEREIVLLASMAFLAYLAGKAAVGLTRGWRARRTHRRIQLQIQSARAFAEHRLSQPELLRLTVYRELCDEALRRGHSMGSARDIAMRACELGADAGALERAERELGDGR